jgi:transposase-like protein
MAKSGLTEQDKRDFDTFARMAGGMEERRRELLSEAHRRAELELHQYRLTVLSSLKEMLTRFTVSMIVRETGIARSTVYRWIERMRNEDIMAEAASKGIVLESTIVTPALQSAAQFASQYSDDAHLLATSGSSTPEELGWHKARLSASGEVGATDLAGDQWVFTLDGEAWNKTRNEVSDGFAEWPSGAKEVFDSLTQ